MISINRGLMDAHVRDGVYKRAVIKSPHSVGYLSLSLFSGAMPTKSAWEALVEADKNTLMQGNSLGVNTVLTHSFNIYALNYNPSNGYTYTNPYNAVTVLEDANANAIGIKFNMRILDRPICSAAGLAEWFVLSRMSTDNTVTATADYQQFSTPFIGTVGTIGSGADMEISNTTLAVGDEVILRDISYIPSLTF